MFDPAAATVMWGCSSTTRLEAGCCTGQRHHTLSATPTHLGHRPDRLHARGGGRLLLLRLHRQLLFVACERGAGRDESVGRADLPRHKVAVPAAGGGTTGSTTGSTIVKSSTFWSAALRHPFDLLKLPIPGPPGPHLL